MRLSAAQSSVVSILLARDQIAAERMSKRGLKTLDALDGKQLATHAAGVWTLTDKGKKAAALLGIEPVTACVHCFRTTTALDDDGVCALCAQKAAAKLGTATLGEGDDTTTYSVGEEVRYADEDGGGRFKIAFFTMRGGVAFAHARKSSLGPFPIDALVGVKKRDTDIALAWAGPVLDRVTHCTRSGVVTGYFTHQQTEEEAAAFAAAQNAYNEAAKDDAAAEKAFVDAAPKMEVVILRGRCKVAFGSVTQFAVAVRKGKHIADDDLRAFCKLAKAEPSEKLPYNALACVPVETIETDAKRAQRGHFAERYKGKSRIWINGKEYAIMRAEPEDCPLARYGVESVNRHTAYTLTRVGDSGWYFRADETGRRYAVKTIAFGDSDAEPPREAAAVSCALCDAADVIEGEQDGDWGDDAHVTSISELIAEAYAKGDYIAADALETVAEATGFELDVDDGSPDLSDPATLDDWNRYETEKGLWPDEPLTTVPLDNQTGLPVSFGKWRAAFVNGSEPLLAEPITATPSLAFVAFCARYGGSKASVARALGIHAVQLHRYFKQARIDAGAELAPKGAHAVKTPMVRLIAALCRLADAGLSVDF